MKREIIIRDKLIVKVFKNLNKSYGFYKIFIIYKLVRIYMEF